MNLKNILSLTGISVLLFSCDFTTKAYQETFKEQELPKADSVPTDKENKSIFELVSDASDNTEPAAVKEEINLLKDAKKLGQIQLQLQDMFPAKELFVFPPHIYFESDRIRLQLVDPDIPDNIDWYYYQTKTKTWQKEEPVKTHMHLKRTPVPLNVIKFSTAADIYDQLAEKVQAVEGAKIPSTVYFSFHVPVWNWNARITGSRADYDFKADKEGQEIEFKRQ